MVYLVAHPFDRKWITKTDTGYGWGEYEDRVKFQNYFKAKAAYDTMEPVRDSYNSHMKPHFMNIGNL